MYRGLDEDCQTNRKKYASDTTDVIRPEKVLSHTASRTPATHAQDDAAVFGTVLEERSGGRDIPRGDRYRGGSNDAGEYTSDVGRTCGKTEDEATRR